MSEISPPGNAFEALPRQKPIPLKGVFRNLSPK